MPGVRVAIAFLLIAGCAEHSEPPLDLEAPDAAREVEVEFAVLPEAARDDAELEAIAPYAINAQVKVEISREGGKKEPADMARILEILRAARYSGYVALEYEAAEDPFEAIPQHLKTLKSLIG